jgi:uncharacterized protein (DUF1800 family)
LQVAEMRATNRLYDPSTRWPFSETLYALRNRPWERVTPDGYPEETAYWMGPDAMRIRLETAQMNAWALQQVKPLSTTALDLVDRLFAGALTGASRRAVKLAPDLQNGLVSIFMIPEFQRR